MADTPVNDCEELKTVVLFRTERHGPFAGDVTAVFPGIPGRLNLWTCYAHVGQHSSCSPEWVRRTRNARPAEYASLLKELHAIGYTNLRLIYRVPSR